MAPSTMHSPGSFFLLMEEWLEMEGTCVSRCPEQVHGDSRRAVSAPPPAGITNWGWPSSPSGTLRSQTAHKEWTAGGAGLPRTLPLPPLGLPGEAW